MDTTAGLFWLHISVPVLGAAACAVAVGCSLATLRRTRALQLACSETLAAMRGERLLDLQARTLVDLLTQLIAHAAAVDEARPHLEQRSPHEDGRPPPPPADPLVVPRLHAARARLEVLRQFLDDLLPGPDETAQRLRQLIDEHLRPHPVVGVPLPGLGEALHLVEELRGCARLLGVFPPPARPTRASAPGR